MKLFKKIISISLFALILCLNTNNSFSEVFVNLSKKERNKIINEKLTKEQQNPSNIPLALISSGHYTNKTLNQPLIITESANGQILISNCIFEQDIIIASKNLSKINIQNSSIKGDIYIIDTMKNFKLDINNSIVKNIFVNSPVSINQYGNKTNIKDIVISKDFPKENLISINANVKSLINNSQGVNVQFNGNIDKIVGNKVFVISGNYKYKVEMNSDNSYPSTFVYDLSQFSPNKGYSNIKDGTSYQDLYELIKQNKHLRKEKTKIIVKNMNDVNVSNLNDTLVDKFSKYISNQISGIFVTGTNDAISKYHILNIYFIYDTDNDKIKISEDIINKKYMSLKHLNGVDYIKEVNKEIAKDMVYDNTLSKHSIYDAVVNKTAVCEGYAKTGYELLQKKFGEDNTLLIVNDEHMWNMVKLGSKWYHIDFTHNDPATIPYDPNYYSEDFLLLTDSQLKERSKGRTWNYNSYPKAQ